MKRMFALVALLAALGVLLKLAGKGVLDRTPPPGVSLAGSSGGLRSGAGTGAHAGTPRPYGSATTALPPTSEAVAALTARYAEEPEATLVRRAVEKFGNNAVRVEATDGLRGLRLLDTLDLQAILLYEKYPREFRQLRDWIQDDAVAAEILLRWREYFGEDWSGDADRGQLIAEMTQMRASARNLVAKFPNILPLVLAAPNEMTELVATWQGSERELQDAFAVLMFVSLESGTRDLRVALRALENNRHLALEAFRLRGMEGFGLVCLYGDVLRELGDALPLNQALIVLLVNSDHVDRVLRTRTPEQVAQVLRHLVARNLIPEAGGHPSALRLVMEFGEDGENALRAAGPDAAGVVFETFQDADLRSRAVSAMAVHGMTAMVLLEKYAEDADFREILRRYGPDIFPVIAKADMAPEALARLQETEKKGFLELLAQNVMYLSKESGQSVITQIRKDGLTRLETLQKTEIAFYQFLPLYDVMHLGHVVSKGYAPTSGEMAWAVVDGCFVIADALSLATLQPEGVAAAELTRSQLKTAARTTVDAGGREAVERSERVLAQTMAKQGKTAVDRWSRWWTVRRSGGAFRLLEKLPEVMPKLSWDQVAAMGRAICAKAGIKVSNVTGFALMRPGVKNALQAMAQKSPKYVGLQLTQASVGLMAMYKVEEHLRSRRALPNADHEEISAGLVPVAGPTPFLNVGHETNPR